MSLKPPLTVCAQGADLTGMGERQDADCFLAYNRLGRVAVAVFVHVFTERGIGNGGDSFQILSNGNIAELNEQIGF